MMYEFQHKGTEKLFCHRYQARVVNYFLILLVLSRAAQGEMIILSKFMKNEENKKLMKEFDCAPGGHFLCDFKVPLLTTLHRLLDILEKL